MLVAVLAGLLAGGAASAEGARVGIGTKVRVDVRTCYVIGVSVTRYSGARRRSRAAVVAGIYHYNDSFNSWQLGGRGRDVSRRGRRGRARVRLTHPISRWPAIMQVGYHRVSFRRATYRTRDVSRLGCA